MCEDKLSSQQDDIVIVRVWGDHKDMNIMFDRQREISTMKTLSREGLIPKFYASFQNGYVHGFYPGKSLTMDHLKKEHILKSLAMKLHEVHFTKYEHEPNDEPWLVKNINFCWNYMKEKNIIFPILPSYCVMETHVELCRSLYDDMLKRHPLVFCHNDLHVANIVFDELKGGMCLIDWEYSGLNMELYDVVRVLELDLTMQGLYCNEETTRNWLRIYLEQHPKYGESIRQGDQQLFDMWFEDSKKMAIIHAMFCVTVCCMCLSNIERGPELQPFLDYYYKRFLELKNHID